MYRFLFLTLFLFLLSSILFAQAPDTLWTRTFGGNGHNCGNSVQQTSDGGFVLTGRFANDPTSRLGKIWLIKTDVYGDTMWTKKYSGKGGVSVKQTFDEGYIIAGNSEWLIKTDVNGDTMWTKKFDESNFNSVWQTSDSGYVVVGSKNGDVLLLKTDDSGDTLWTKTFGDTLYDCGNSVQQTSDSGYIITGYNDLDHANGNSDLWLIKTDASGDTLWTKTFGDTLFECGNSVQQTSDGGYIITGHKDFDDFSWDSDLWLIKTDALGDTIWTKTFGDTLINEGYSVQQTSDGGYIITGYKDHTPQFIGEIHPQLIHGNGVPGAKDYLPLGTDDLWLIKTDASGDTIWTKTIGDIHRDGGHSVQQTSDGGYVVTGVTDDDYGLGWAEGKIWLIKIATDPSNVGNNNQKKLLSDFMLRQNYPNPFNPTTTIEFDLPKSCEVTLKVFNILGEEVTTLVSDRLSTGLYTYEWDAGNFASGVYLYKLQAGDYVETRKMILMR